MLARENRLSTADTFRSTMRSGSKHATAHLVVYLKRVETNSARFGFVVSKAVGNAVQRNLVKRRLRALAKNHLIALQGCDVVVRATASAAETPWQELSVEFDSAIAAIGQKRPTTK